LILHLVKISDEGFNDLRLFISSIFKELQIKSISTDDLFIQLKKGIEGLVVVHVGTYSEESFSIVLEIANKLKEYGSLIFVVEELKNYVERGDDLLKKYHFIEFPGDSEVLKNLIEMKIKNFNVDFSEKIDSNKEDNLPSIKRRLQEALMKVKNLENEVDRLKYVLGKDKLFNQNLIKEIEEKKTLIKALELGERKFRLLFELNEDIILFLKVEGEKIIIEDANKTASLLLGYSREELPGKNIFDLYLNNKEEVIKKIFNVINTNGRREYLTHLTRDGKNVKVEILAHRIFIENSEYAYLYERNVTKEEEMNLQIKKLSEIIEQSPIAVVMTGANGEIEYVNRNFLQLSGYEEEEVLGKSTEIFSPDNFKREEVHELIQTIKGGDIWFGKMKMKNKENRILSISTVSFPITNEDGVITNFVGILQDITKEEEMIEDLRKAKEEAQKANRLKSEFLARISHEIRTPLNTVINFTQILFEELPESNNRIVKLSKEAIIDASKRIVRTIDLILNIAMIESGNVKVNIEKFDLFRECLKPIIQQYSHLAKKKGLTFIQNVETKDFLIEADKNLAYQIFINLIDNAVKFTEKGFVEVKILRDEKGRLSVQITDTGKGIDQEYLPKIFEPFTQEEMGYSRNFEGVGLGMSLVKSYCNMLNAEINIFSKKNIGTKVTVIFEHYKETL